MKKIDPKTANTFIGNFEATMKKAGMDKPENGFTRCVYFNRKDLIEWLDKLGPDTEQIRLFFAAYPKDSTRSSPNTQSGRLTAVLWPCNKDGEPAEDEEGNPEPPVNYGELIP